MSTPLAVDSTPRGVPSAQHVAVARAVLALLWAGALVVAIGGDVPRTDSDVPAFGAALLATYPLIDAVASFLGAERRGAPGRIVRADAVVSVAAAIAIGIAAFGVDAGATLVTFGAWAAVSGALQLGVAILRRGAGHQLPMMISGGLSTVAGLSFVAAADGTEAELATLAGYMALGALLFLVWALRARPAR